MCPVDSTPLALQSFLLTTLQHHLEGDENVFTQLESVLVDIHSNAQKKDLFTSQWKLRYFNNALAMRWDDEADPESSFALCEEMKTLLNETAPGAQEDLFEEVRQMMNTAGGFYLNRNKTEEGGEILKQALKLSDERGIVLTENVILIFLNFDR